MRCCGECFPPSDQLLAVEPDRPSCLEHACRLSQHDAVRSARERCCLRPWHNGFDAVVVDVYHRGRSPFQRIHVRGMKFKKLGARRLALAYMNVGQADSSRYYWKPGWREGRPSFLGSPVLGEPDNHYVQYWNPAWKNIIAGDTKSYTYGIIAQGYDGVVIDGVDSYLFFEGATR